MLRRVATIALIVVGMVGLPAAGAFAATRDSVVRVPAPIHGSYIVKLRQGESIGNAVRSISGERGVSRSRALSKLGMVVVRATDDAAQRLSRMPSIESVTEDGRVSIATTTQTSPPWGLDRIDQHPRTLDSRYTYGATGFGVTAYVIDTGIYPAHQEFGGRASVGYDAFGGNGIDCHGHGTHVSGTIGGRTYGVAKQVTLVGVRVLDCTGSGADSVVIDGINWVMSHRSGPSVANMSLGGASDPTLDAAVDALVQSGVPVAVAAGNSNGDACLASPARVASAITVGATVSTDARASYSNFGRCLDIFAPGSGVLSAWYTSPSATRTISGTSMASPHVAGAIAVYLQQVPTATPAQVATFLRSNATANVVTLAGSGSPNYLLYSPSTGAPGGGGPVNQAPVAAFTQTCSQLSCTFMDQSTDDGSIASWAWDFGDGTSSTQTNPSHTYSAAGSFTVRLTVTDNLGLTGTTSHGVGVNTTSRTLSAALTAYRSVTLTWSGLSGSYLDVYRNSVRVLIVLNNGGVRNTLPDAGTFVYQVCTRGTTTCSNTASVTAT